MTATSESAGGARGRPARRRDFAGWRMVWALALTEAISYGALFYSFAVMVVPMRASFGASTAELSVALTISVAVTGIAAVPVGVWLDRHGARALMTAGSLLGAAAALGWSRAQNLPELYLAYACMGLAGAAVFYEPAFAVINAWFHRDRHLALLTLTMIAGFSSTVFLPLSQALVDAFGWRHAVQVLAALTAACAVPHALLLRRAPLDLGLHPDGVPPADAVPADAVPADAVPADAVPGADNAGELAVLHQPTSARAAWRTAPVRWLTAATFLETVAVTVVAVHLVAYLRDSGIGPGLAAGTAGSIGIMQVAGRITLSRLAARRGIGRVASVMVAGQALGVAALFALPRPTGVALFVVLFGAGFGVMTIARPAMLGNYVPPRIFASVSGGQALAANAGRVLAPVSAGALITGLGYGPAFTVVAACSLATAVLLIAAGRAANP